MSETQAQDAGIFTFNKPQRLTFPNVMEAKAVMRNGKATGEPKFSANFEFLPDDEDLAAAKARAIAVARAARPGIALTELDFPFSDGNKLADKAKAKGKDREWSRGRVVLTARSKFEPSLAILEGGQLVDYEGEKRPLAKSAFYTGAEVLAQVNFQYYDAVGDNGKAGVTAYLNKVVSLKRGAKLAGGASAAETFKGYVGLQSDESVLGDSTNLDDEIPF